MKEIKELEKKVDRLVNELLGALQAVYEQNKKLAYENKRLKKGKV